MTKCYNCQTKIVPKLWFSIQTQKPKSTCNKNRSLKKSESICSGLNRHQYKFLWFCCSSCMRQYASEIQSNF